MILAADEVGFMMTPSVKKTWARNACTPTVPYRNRNQKKISVLGAVALHPATGTVDLRCDLHPDSYVRGEQAAAFLHRVLAEFPGLPIDLVWDNLQAHKSPIVKEVLANHPRLSLHYLPPYAPDLNPVEGVWCLTKHHRMLPAPAGSPHRAWICGTAGSGVHRRRSDCPSPVRRGTRGALS